MDESIYHRPEAYDLEHEGDTEDVDFFVRLANELKPARVLELACGSGRVAVPLAEAGARNGFDVAGLELVPEMLADAERRRAGSPPDVQTRLTLVRGDMRTWRSDGPFDLVLSPCSSMCHLLSLDDQLAAWRTAHANLAPGGRFAVDVSMPNLAAYADSLADPPRAILEVDRDTRDADKNERLLRFKTTRFYIHEQRAEVRYLYDRFVEDTARERFASDYECHVYFPRELQLLFLHTGFSIERMFGDYFGRPLGPKSRQMILVGVKGE